MSICRDAEFEYRREWERFEEMPAEIKLALLLKRAQWECRFLHPPVPALPPPLTEEERARREDIKQRRAIWFANWKKANHKEQTSIFLP